MGVEEGRDGLSDASADCAVLDGHHAAERGADLVEQLQDEGLAVPT